jgi:formiminotetrahydrofolate cyclodeaminase
MPDALPEFRDISVGDLLDLIPSEQAQPGGGAVAALAAAFAASLVEMVARASTASWGEASGVAAQAGALVDRATDLANQSPRAFHEARSALQSAREFGPLADDAEIGRALARAAEVPLRIAETAADAAALAEEVAERGNPDLGGDAAVAVVLAAAAARAATHLAEINLVAGADEEVLGRAREATHSAARAAERMVGASR